MAEATGRDLTADELKVYDRQVRVWGLEKQKRMLQSKILFLSLDGTNSEVLKNCVLAGVGACTIVEDSIVTKENVESHFYLAPSHIGQKWSEVALKYFHEMNPRVQLDIRTKSDIQGNAESMKGYTIVSMSNQDLKFQQQMAAKCRELNIAYFYSRSCGLYGTAFCDCIEFHWSKTITREQPMFAEEGEPMDIDNIQTEQIKIKMKNCYPSFDSVCTCQLAKLRKRTKFAPALFITVQAFEQAISEGTDRTKAQIIQNIQANCAARGLDANAIVNEELIEKLMTTFDCNIGIVNAWLAGYISNSVITCVQQDEKHPPFLNMFAVDAFGSAIHQYKIGKCTQDNIGELTEL